MAAIEGGFAFGPRGEAAGLEEFPAEYAQKATAD